MRHVCSLWPNMLRMNTWQREGLKKRIFFLENSSKLGGGVSARFSTKKKTQKNMGLKHWIWHNNHFKTHLFFLIFGRGDPFQLRSWSEGWLKQVSEVPYHTEFVLLCVDYCHTRAPVPACKMEPRSGMIMELMTTRPPTRPPGASIFKY